MVKNEHKIKIGISQGDINGVGYELVIKTFLDKRMLEVCTPIVYGSSKVLAYHRKAIDVESFSVKAIQSIDEVQHGVVNIINVVSDDIKVELGQQTQEAGKASFDALEKASSDLTSGKIDALVTCPIHKGNIQSDDFKFPGHTEYLQQKSGDSEVLMFMCSQLLKVGLVTGHVPINEVSKYITKDRIMQKLQLMQKSLIKDFGIRKPKIAVFGLNPHAGDGGLLGKEDQEIIEPTLKEANDQGILALGPFSADGFFGSGAFKKFDAILAMYHDQGLVPFKALSFDEGVNFTAGLSVIRTSPAHGTAFAIAGKGEASEKSFRNAVYMACDVVLQRRMHERITSNPLKTKQKNTAE